MGAHGVLEFSQAAKAQNDFQNNRQETLAQAEWQVQERPLGPV